MQQDPPESSFLQQRHHFFEVADVVFYELGVTAQRFPQFWVYDISDLFLLLPFL